MITTRDYAHENQADFVLLYRACLAHYGLGPASDAEEARVVSLLEQGQHMSCLMAYSEDTPVGFATWALTFPAGTGVGLYMKELFVAADARGMGVGRALLKGLLDLATANDYTRVDWQTDGDNALSQAFYRRLDAPEFDKKTYRISAEDYASFRAKLDR